MSGSMEILWQDRRITIERQTKGRGFLWANFGPLRRKPAFLSQS